MKKFNWLFKKDDLTKPKNKRFKNITLLVISALSAGLSVAGLCIGNGCSINVENKNVNFIKSSSSQNLDSIQEVKARIKEWNIDSTSSNFITSFTNEINMCNNKNFVESMIKYHLTDYQYELIKNELFKVKNYFNLNEQDSKLLSVNPNQMSNQLKQIIENSMIQLSPLIKELKKQKDILGGIGIIIAVILAVLTFCGLNYAIFIPSTIIGLIGICCGCTSNAINSLTTNCCEYSSFIYSGYTMLIPSTNVQIFDVTTTIQGILPWYKQIKNQLVTFQGIYGTKQMLDDVNNTINQLENMLATLNKYSN